MLKPDYPDRIRFAQSQVWRQALAEAKTLADTEWSPHFNQGKHNGGWQGVALRASALSKLAISPGEHAQEVYKDQAWLAECPGLAALISEIPCPLKSVRVLRLLPGGEIHEHRDAGVSLAHGEARLHCVLQTNEKVFLYLKGQRVPMREGEWWYLDVSQPHRVVNQSAQPRLHLVLDCVVNDWLLQKLCEGDSGQPWSDPLDAQVQFQGFCEQVFRDEGLQTALMAQSDRQAFCMAVLEAGRAAGYQFGIAELQSAMNQNHRAWIEQWIL